MVENPTAITPPSTIGSKQYWISCSLPCLVYFHQRDFLYQSQFERYRGRESSGKIHFWTVFVANCYLLWPLLDQAIIWMSFFVMLSRFWIVEIINKHSVLKLCFSHSRFASLRSHQVNLYFWKFNHLMKSIFGYVIFIIMHYNLTIWILGILFFLLFMVDWNCCKKWFYVNWMKLAWKEWGNTWFLKAMLSINYASKGDAV